MTKLAKVEKNWKITPSELSCQPEKGQLTFLNFHWKVRIWTWICLESKSHHVQTCTDTIGMLVSSEPRPLPTPLPRSLWRCKKEPLNHIWIPNQFTFKCARISFECAGKCAEGLELLHLQVCKIASESHLNANMLRVWSASHSNVLGFASECDSPQEPNHFAFKRAGIHVWIASECWSPQGSNLPHNPMCSVFHSHSWWSTDKRLQPTAADLLFTLTHLRYGFNYFYLFQLHCVMYVYCCFNRHL